jgi:hypothetical protein
MGRRPFAMLSNAVNFCVKEGKSRVELIQRVALQAFAGEKAGSAQVILGRPQRRSIIVVHCTAASNGNPFESMAGKGGRGKGVPQTRDPVAQGSSW